MKLACLLFLITFQLKAQKDTVIYNITYRDTVIYKYKVIQINQYVYNDTIKSSPVKKKKVINQNNWGIGPSVGAYYSPFNGFDVNIGFGIQYYLISIPSFKNPHTGHKRKR